MFANGSRLPAPRSTFALAAALFAGACSGGGTQAGALMPAANPGGPGALGGVGNIVVRIFVPTAQQSGFGKPPLAVPPAPPVAAPPSPPVFGGALLPVATSQPAGPSTPPPPGSQLLAINVNGPTAVNQTVTVGPNAAGCTPATGGTSCQLSLSLSAGTYIGTIGPPNAPSATAIAFTVAPNAQNLLGLSLNGVPAQLTIVPASTLSTQNAQGGIDLYGAGRHPLLVEALDANQNVIVGPVSATVALNQAGGALPLIVTQAGTSVPNLFYVSSPGVGTASSATLRATENALGGTVRVDVRQILSVANSNANSITLYVNGQSAPLATVSSGVINPQALVFDSAGDLFVANEPGSVTVYASPYNLTPITIGNNVIHPQALAIDPRGNLFVANGTGSNTVSVYAPPYGGAPAATISAGVNDPVSLALDASSDLFVVNAAANTVTVYAPPYSGTPTVIAKGLNAPNSLALDVRGNLFVANLNSTPNSVVEYSPPFSNQSAPVATITDGINEQGTIGLSASANLFVPNEGANTVTEYVAPYSGTPTTIVGGQSQPVALAIDALGNLYVANYGNNTVTVYAPPYANGSWTTLSNGVSLPIALALSPATNAATVLLP